MNEEEHRPQDTRIYSEIFQNTQNEFSVNVEGAIDREVPVITLTADTNLESLVKRFTPQDGSMLVFHGSSFKGIDQVLVQGLYGKVNEPNVSLDIKDPVMYRKAVARSNVPNTRGLYVISAPSENLTFIGEKKWASSNQVSPDGGKVYFKPEQIVAIFRLNDVPSDVTHK